MAKGFIEPGEKPRRFYKDVTVAEADGGYAILLDGRRLKTPKGQALALPTLAVAEQVAEDWALQGEHLELADMHASRLANTTIDSVAPAREAVADQIVQYAGTDLTCYFAEDPQELVERQLSQWGPLLERAEAEERLRFLRTAGIVHQEQPAETLARVREIALSLDDFALAGLAFGVPLYGSAVLGIAVLRAWVGGEAAFELSRLDESFQEEQWGVDAEAAERTQRLRGEARMLDRWFRSLAS